MNPFEAVVAAVGHHSKRSEWAAVGKIHQSCPSKPHDDGETCEPNQKQWENSFQAFGHGCRYAHLEQKHPQSHGVMSHLPDSGTGCGFNNTAPRYHLLFLGWGTS